MPIGTAIDSPDVLNGCGSQLRDHRSFFFFYHENSTEKIKKERGLHSTPPPSSRKNRGEGLPASQRENELKLRTRLTAKIIMIMIIMINCITVGKPMGLCPLDHYS